MHPTWTAARSLTFPRVCSPTDGCCRFARTGRRRSVIRHASNDPRQIAEWLKEKPGCNWGMRIWSDSLLVIDAEGPTKGDGQRALDAAAREAGHFLPRCPTASTPSSGRHYYLAVPLEYRGALKNWVKVLPGVDLRVRRGMIAIPPSADRVWIISPDQVDFPEAPAWLLDMFISLRRPKVVDATKRHALKREEQAETGSAGQLESIPYHVEQVSKRAWIKLWRSKGFAQTWNRHRRFPADNSLSAYEFDIAKRSLACGLTPAQTLGVILAFRTHHRVKGPIARLTRYTIPRAWDQVRGYVESWTARKEAEAARKAAAKTTARIIALLQDGPASPAEVGTALGISAVAARKACSRLAAQAKLSVASGRYSVVVPIVTLVPPENNRNAIV